MKKGELIRAAVFDAADISSIAMYVRAWKEPTGLSRENTVRTFRRTVKADGVGFEVVAVIVRERLPKAPAAEHCPNCDARQPDDEGICCIACGAPLADNAYNAAMDRYKLSAGEES